MSDRLKLEVGVLLLNLKEQPTLMLKGPLVEVSTLGSLQELENSMKPLVHTNVGASVILE